MTPAKGNIREKLAKIAAYWSPKVIAELNGQQVKLVKFQGEFVWHSHADEDEMFLVVEGSFEMKWRDAAGTEMSDWLAAGDFFVVPRGVEHCPVAPSEVAALLFEPASTVNTGDAQDARRTVELRTVELERI